MRRQRGVLVLVSIVGVLVGAGMRLGLRPSIEDQERAAQEALRHGNLDVAEELARVVLGRSPEAQRAREVLVRAARMQGKTSMLVALYRDVPVAADGAARARFQAGEVAFQAGLARVAEESWEEALALEPGLVPAYDRLIALAGIRQDTEEVFRLLRLRSEHAPQTSQSIRLLLGAESLGRDSAGWQGTLRKFVEEDAFDIDSLVGLARRWIELGHPAEAVDVLPGSMLNRDGAVVKAHAYLLMNDIDFASVSLGDYPREPVSGDLLFVESLIASAVGQNDVALDSLERATKLRPLSRTIRAQFCKVLRDVGDAERNARESALLTPLQEIEEIAKNPQRPLDVETVDLLIRHCEAVEAREVVEALREFRASLETGSPTE